MGRVTHFEIHAGDPDRAISFYKNVFGWEFNKWEGPEEYWLINTGSADEPGINGGLMKRQGEIDGQAVIAFVCTAAVDSVDKTLKKAEENGGKVVVAKMVIPNIGYQVYCKDTEGNIFGIHQTDPNAK
jgi:predicted enzyme related to lactoylglutathione lyase